MTEPNRPRALRKGDTVALVGPSGPLDEGVLAKCEKAVRDLGYVPRSLKSAGARHGYLSGVDEVRAASLNAAFQMDDVAAILCTRGGYGAARLLDRLDYDLARRQPKILLGYSDITALHLAYFARSGLISFHGPMVGGWTREDFDALSLSSMMTALQSAQALGDYPHIPGHPVTPVVPGLARGRLIGGNLSLIASLAGSGYWPDTDGFILLIEDVDEDIYAIDRMLTTLRLSGLLDRAAGFILGQFTNCAPKENRDSLTLSQVIDDLIAPFGKPTLAGLMFGHELPNITTPLGVLCEIDANAGRLTYLERALNP